MVDRSQWEYDPDGRERRDDWLARAMHKHGATWQDILAATGRKRSAQYYLFKRKIPKTLRRKVLERDNATCRYCGANDPSWLSIDHIYPKSKGGPTTLENLQVLCRNCNSSKGKRIPVGVAA